MGLDIYIILLTEEILIPFAEMVVYTRGITARITTLVFHTLEEENNPGILIDGMDCRTTFA